MLKPEQIFIFLGVLFGLLFLFKTPVFQVPDEPMHLLRACEVSTGVIHNNKDGNYKKDIFPMRKLVLKKNYGMFSQFKDQKHYTELLEFNNLNYTHNNSGYSFILYLPSAIGLKISSLITSNPYVIFYTTRFFNLFTWLALIYFAIKLTPFKWQYMICALFPMAIYEGMSISADSVNLAFAFLYTAFIFYLAYVKKNPVSSRDLTALIFMTILSVLFKGIFLFSILLLLIPRNKFKYKFPVIASLLIAQILLLIFIGTNSHILTANGVDINQRKLMILEEPLYVTNLFLNTFLHKSSFYLQSSIFRLGWLEIKPNPIPVFLLFFAYLAGSMLDKIRVRLADKFVVLGVNGIFILLTTLLYFLTFAPLEDNLIIGTQGRYFIPLFLTFAAITQNSLNINKPIYLKAGIIIVILLNLIYAAYLI